MTQSSAPDLLVLHAVRILGFADTPVIAGRFGLDVAQTQETLRDAEARGWAGSSAFADLRGWSLTASGRTQNERLLAAELPTGWRPRRRRAGRISTRSRISRG